MVYQIWTFEIYPSRKDLSTTVVLQAVPLGSKAARNDVYLLQILLNQATPAMLELNLPSGHVKHVKIALENGNSNGQMEVLKFNGIQWDVVKFNDMPSGDLLHIYGKWPCI